MWENERLPQKFSGVWGGGGTVGSKLEITYTYMHEYIQWNTTHLKEKKMQFPTARMNWEGTMLNEVSQTEKRKYCMFLLMWNSKK